MAHHPPKKIAVQALTLALILGLAAWAQFPEPDGGTVEAGILPAEWITGGPKCMESPEFQVHEYNEDFYILRQSGCSHYEKPFLYLIFGDDKALLLDTGAGDPNVKFWVEQTIERWLERKGKDSIHLVVAHTHNHSDHVAADKQFQNVRGVTFAGADYDSMIKFWGFKNFPDEFLEYDLGGRTLDIFGIPGHQKASVGFYDRRTGILISGDIVYPGRLYIDDPAAFAASIDRMIEFTKDKPVTHVLGCHIEQTNTPFLEYPIGTIYQPDEHELEFARGQLFELQAVVRDLEGDLPRLALRSLTIYPVNQDVWQELRDRRKEVEDELRKTQWDQPPAD